VLLISPAPSQRASKQAPLSQLLTHRQPASQLPAAQVRRSRRVFLQITPQWRRASLFARSCPQNWGLLAFLVEAPSNPHVSSSDLPAGLRWHHGGDHGPVSGAEGSSKPPSREATIYRTSSRLDECETCRTACSLSWFRAARHAQEERDPLGLDAKVTLKPSGTVTGSPS
jgi:hypothetical protein